jgi:uncharacterized protein YbdZ (MbtH family)
MTNNINTNGAPNPFDPNSLRISGDINTVGAEKVLLHISVRKPNKQEFFRVNTDANLRLPCAILELKDEREFYMVAPNMLHALSEDVRHVELRLCQNRQGVTFLWPVPMPSSDGRANTWHQSAREAAAHAEKHWTRMTANMSEGGYSIFRATGAIPDPQWQDKTMEELLKLAFKGGKLIDTEDHPVIQQLNGG